MDELKKDYVGPLCLYQILDERRKKNPQFLMRNLQLTAQSRRLQPKTNPYTVELEFPTLKSGFLISLHLLGKIQADIGIRYEPLCSINLHPSQSLKCSLIAEKEGHPVAILILYSSEESGRTFISHLKWATSLCRKLSNFDFANCPIEDITIKVPSPACLIDISTFQNNPKSHSRFFDCQFSAFMRPCYRTSFPAVLIDELQCNCWSFDDPEVNPDKVIIPFTIRISDSTNTQKRSIQSAQTNNKSVYDRTKPRSISKTELSVLFHLVSNRKDSNETFVWHESRSYVCCPFCTSYKRKGGSVEYDKLKKKLSDSSAKELEELAIHLLSFHPHFGYEFSIDFQGNIHIMMQRKHLESHMQAIKCSYSNMGEAEEDQQQASETRKSEKYRQFYHSTTGQMITPAELQYDSDNEVDNSVEIKLQHSIIDEFSDLTTQEKEFMKLWNTHVATFPPYGDKLIPVVCEVFVKKFSGVIIKKKLRHNALLHFMSMWDFGLLLSEEVHQFLSHIDQQSLNSIGKI